MWYRTSSECPEHAVVSESVPYLVRSTEGNFDISGMSDDKGRRHFLWLTL